MKYLLALLYIGLGLPLFDINRRRKLSIFSDDETSYELSEKKRSIKKVKRKYRKGKRKRRANFRQSHHYELKGTNAKDSRYSNGNKLRRMFINM